MQAYHNSFYAMGTRFNAVFAYEDNCTCENVFQLIKAEVLRIEKRLNYFDPASDLSRINRSDLNRNIHVDDELYSILDKCLQYSVLTEGAFDVTIGSAKESSAGISYNYIAPSEKIFLDLENKVIRLLYPKIKIDLGGFGKGYALECIKFILDASPIENGIISFGGSSITAFGKHPCGNEWQIGINDLFKTEEQVVTVGLCDNSISVSCNYFVDDGGRLINKKHIINPHNFNFSDEVKIVVVNSDSPLQAEILSTAFMNMDENKIKQLLKQFEKVAAITIVYNDGAPTVKQI